MARPKRYETAAERQRAYRKRKKGVVGGAEKREVASPYVHETKRALVSQAAPPSKSKIEDLRELMEEAPREPTAPVVKPLIYRNDYGAIITERQWQMLQERNRKAKENGYEIDEYSQFK